MTDYRVLIPRVVLSIFGMFVLTVLALVCIGSTFPSAGPPVRGMLAGPFLASRFGTPPNGGVYDVSAASDPAVTRHAWTDRLQPRERLVHLVDTKQSTSNNHRHTSRRSAAGWCDRGSAQSPPLSIDHHEGVSLSTMYGNQRRRWARICRSRRGILFPVSHHSDQKNPGPEKGQRGGLGSCGEIGSGNLWRSIDVDGFFQCEIIFPTVTRDAV